MFHAASHTSMAKQFFREFYKICFNDWPTKLRTCGPVSSSEETKIIAVNNAGIGNLGPNHL